MTISTNYNPSSLTVQRYLGNATNSMNKALERMSTGFRVNCAADDAAGMYVSTGLTTQIRGLSQGRKNALDGISLLQTASGAFGNMQDILQRLRDLSVQASNGVYGKNEMDAMQREAEELTKQLYQIKNGTKFNGFSLFGKKQENYAPVMRSANIRTADSAAVSVKSFLAKESGSDSSPVGGYTPPNGSIDEVLPPTIDSGSEISSPENDPNYEPAVYNPGVQMTGSQMSMLKSYLESGGSYEEFLDAFKQGKHAELVDRHAEPINRHAELVSASQGTETLKLVQGDGGIQGNSGEGRNDVSGIQGDSSIQSNKITRAEDPLGAGGTEDFTGGQTKVVTIDGVNYTIKNKLSSAQSIIWRKEDTGVLTIEGSNFEIRAASDVSHNIEYRGRSNTIYGGDMNDKITVSGDFTYNTVYAGAGDDEIIYNDGDYITVYLQSGNNTFTKNSTRMCTVIGGTGNDTFNLNGKNGLTPRYKITTGDGNNIINFGNNTYNYMIEGGNGNNTYNFNSANANDILIIGKVGNNTINNTINNVQTNKMISGNFNINGLDNFVRATALEFTANETKSNITLVDGKSYTITNNKNTSDLMIVKMVADTLTCVTTTDYKIKANQATKFDLGTSSIITFYGSDYNDTIIGGDNSTIYSGKGNDTITTKSRDTVYLQGGDNTVTVEGAGVNVFGGSGNETFYLGNASHLSSVHGGSGNNTFYMNNSNAIAYGGTGNDRFIVKSGVTGVSCIGGGGNNTVEGNLSGAKFLSDMSNAINNATSFLIPANKSNVVNMDIGGANYSFKNQRTEQKYAAYSIDIDGTVSLIASALEMKAQENMYHKINLYGIENDLYGGNSGNTINNYQHYGTIYGGKGDDTLIQNVDGNSHFDCSAGGNNTFIINKNIGGITTGNGNNKVILNAGITNLRAGTGINHFVLNQDNLSFTGGNGNNIYEINGNNCNITGGTSNDTFLINGNNNQAFGGAGDDYFVVNSGATNNIIGGSGKNYMVDNGINTSTPLGDVINDPNSGFLYFNDNTTSQSFTLFGKTYKVTNTTTEGSLLVPNKLQYTYNLNTNEVTFHGDNFTIEAENGKDHNIIVRGNNNVIKGGNGNDHITISAGTNNRIEGTSGNNTIIAETAGNKLIGGTGNDYISSDFTQTLVEGTAGTNTIVINADNTVIRGGTGTDKITVNGQGNDVDGGIGNDNILVSGKDNVVTSSSGSDTIVIRGTSNTLTETGNTNNTVAVEGEGNNVTLGNGNNKITVVTTNTNIAGNTINTGNGSNNFSIQGNLNTVNSGSGVDTFVITGNSNDINSGNGNDRITLNFGSKNKVQGGGGDDTINIGGSENVAMGGDGNDYFNVKNSAVDTEIDGEGGNNEMYNKGKDTIFRNVKDVTLEQVEIRLQVGANSDSNSAIHFRTEFFIGGFQS